MPSNSEIVARGFAALGRRDLDAFLELIDPAVEFTSLVAEAEGETFHGHEGVRDWWRRVAGSLGGLEFGMEDAQELGDLVLARITVTGRVGDVPVSQMMHQVIRACEGRAVSWHFFRTREGAMAGAEAEK